LTATHQGFSLRVRQRSAAWHCWLISGTDALHADNERASETFKETTVRLGPISSFEARTETVRSGARVNSRVAVAVEWDDAGNAMRAEGYTVDTSTKGCLAVIPQELPVGQRLKLVNLVNQNSCDAVLAWRGHQGRTGWEFGLELQGPVADFWGLEF
jgi:hypothetical protein